MKRLFVAFFAATTLFGCAKSEVDTVEGEKVPFTIYVTSSSDADTKTSFDEDKHTVNWSKGDAIAVMVNGSKPYKFTNQTGEDNAFTCDDFMNLEKGKEYEYELLYPYSDDLKFTMSGGIKTPMYGTATVTGSASPEVRMKQLSAIIKVTVNNESAQTVTLSSLRIERADGGVLGGKHTIDGGVVKVVEGSTVTYTEVNGQSKKIAAGGSVDMYLQCAPFTAVSGTSLNITFAVSGVEYSAVKTFAKDVEFAAGKINRTSVSFKQEESKAIKIDFGASNKTTAGWNNVTSTSAEDVFSLKYADDTDSGITLSVGDGWGIQDAVGGEPNTSVTYNDIQYPLTAWSDSFTFSGETARTMTFSGLNPEKKYKFTIAAYRWNGTESARITWVSLTGSTGTESESKKLYQGVKDKTRLEVFDNHFAVFENVVPDAEGKVVLNVTAEMATVQQAHISAMVIE